MESLHPSAHPITWSPLLLSMAHSRFGSLGGIWGAPPLESEISEWDPSMLRHTYVLCSVCF